MKSLKNKLYEPKGAFFKKENLLHNIKTRAVPAIKSVKTLIKNVSVEPWYGAENKVSFQVRKLILKNLGMNLESMHTRLGMNLESMHTRLASSRQIYWHVWDTVCPLEPEE
jgi:hypothetical protein